MQPVVITLKVPIKFGSEDIKELKIRPAKAKDFRDMPLSPKVGDLLNVTAKLTGQPPSVIDELDPIDFMEVAAVVGNFMGSGPLAGGPKSES